MIVLNFGVINAMADTDGVGKTATPAETGRRLAIVAMPPFHLFSALGDFFRCDCRRFIDVSFEKTEFGERNDGALFYQKYAFTDISN
ncbi:MAG: hypothetical protein R3C26_22585 [Calditrichia bacterium]